MNLTFIFFYIFHNCGNYCTTFLRNIEILKKLKLFNIAINSKLFVFVFFFFFLMSEKWNPGLLFSPQTVHRWIYKSFAGPLAK